MFTKFLKFHLTLAVCLAFVSASSLTSATEADMEKVEDSTVSPIADMATFESEMKTSTERPPKMELTTQDEKLSSQRHTVADFIIHPLIAFKPRNPDEEIPLAAGKQADNSSTSTTPSPWQLFGFNAGQGLSSSVSSLAGSVTGWINDRIQLPGLMESPVRESTTSSSTSTTTTTPRPDVVVRVQHKPQSSTRRPIISIGNRNRPNRPNFDSEENDDENEYEENEDNDENYENEDNDSSNEGGDNEASNENEDNNNSDEEEDNEVVEKDEEDEETDESADDDEEEEHSQRPNNRRRPVKNNIRNKQRRGNRPQNSRRRVPNRPARRRPANNNDLSDEEGLNDDDYNDNDSFYFGSRPSTKRSQTSPNFIQRGQQQLLNQIRQLTRGQTPEEIGSAIRKTQTNNANNRRRQQATLFVNRNGQTIYMAPELAQFGQSQYQPMYTQPIVHKTPASSPYPQPPLTVPLKRKGQPVQYITIPWSQLGISPPNNIVSITEGIQAQPFILNIPQSAINTMQNQARPGQVNRKKKRPQLITADAVPLLADASLMNIFKPPQIPPSRTSSVKRPAASITPVLVASKPSSTKTSSVLQQRIRAGTVIEKAPIMEDSKKTVEHETASSEEPKNDLHSANEEQDYILVGKDDEPGLMRQVEPVYGDARFVQLAGDKQYYDVLPRRRFTFQRGSRDLAYSADEKDAQIPVQAKIETESTQLNSKLSESVTSQIQEKETSDSIPTESGAALVNKTENTQQLPESTAT